MLATLKAGWPEVPQPKTASARRAGMAAPISRVTSRARSARSAAGVVRRMSSILSCRDRGVGERERGGGVRAGRAVEGAGEEGEQPRGALLARGVEPRQAGGESARRQAQVR